MTLEQKAAYVAAFIDGEGHIGCHPTAKGFWTRTISCSNTDRELIDKMMGFCADLSLPTRLQSKIAKDRPKWADGWVIYISGGKESFEHFRKIIPLQCTRKAKVLDFICDDSYANMEEVGKRRQNGHESPCQTCGNPVYVSAAFRLRGGGKYCSRTCRVIARTTRVTNKCAICGTEYQVIISRKSSSMFCSLSCFGKSKSEMLRRQASAAANARWHKIG